MSEEDDFVDGGDAPSPERTRRAEAHAQEEIRLRGLAAAYHAIFVSGKGEGHHVSTVMDDLARFCRLCESTVAPRTERFLPSASMERTLTDRSDRPYISRIGIGREPREACSKMSVPAETPMAPAAAP